MKVYSSNEATKGWYQVMSIYFDEKGDILRIYFCKDGYNFGDVYWIVEGEDLKWLSIHETIKLNADID